MLWRRTPVSYAWLQHVPKAETERPGVAVLSTLGAVGGGVYNIQSRRTDPQVRNLQITKSSHTTVGSVSFGSYTHHLLRLTVATKKMDQDAN